MATSGSAPSARPEKKYQKTWKVDGIPKEWVKNQLELFLRHKFRCGVSVQSLAPRIDNQTGQATVTVDGDFTSPMNLPIDENPEAGGITLSKEFYGMTTLFAPRPEDHKLDIIALSGLGGHAFGSFKERDGSHMWLRDSLPEAITHQATEKPMARVIIYGFPSDVAKSSNVQQINDICTSFITSLHPLANATLTKPIMFIGHSLGGIVIKEALVTLVTEDRDEDNLKVLLSATRAIVFFGVPHSGMQIKALKEMATDGPNTALIQSLSGINSKVLLDLSRQFNRLFDKKEDPHFHTRLFCFYETEESHTAVKNDEGFWKMNGPKVMAVDPVSARNCPQSQQSQLCVCAIPRSHSDIVKFSQHDEHYLNVRNKIERIAWHIADMKSNVCLTDSTKECLKTLWFPEMDHRSAAIAHATRGTCTWVLQDSTYKKWLFSSRGLLWIKGHPGVGKSTLMKHIVQEIKQTRYLEPHKSIVTSFFFNNRGAELEKTRLGFYRSVLHQFLIQIPNSLDDLVTFFIGKRDGSGNAGKDWEWLEGDLQRHLTKAISSIAKSHGLWLFVDALDESDDATASTMVKELKSVLAENGDSNVNFHICFTARHFPVLTNSCEYELSVDQRNKSDIRAYALNGLVDSMELSKSEILNTILDRANGIFLWARVALETALRLDREGRSLHFIQVAINAIPPTLEELFESLINTLEGEERAVSLKMMQWICFAKRVMSLDELRWAMVADDDLSKASLEDCRRDPLFIAEDERLKRRLTTLSCGLVEVVHDTRRVQFIHQAVKEFFLHQGLSLLRDIDRATGTDHTGATKEERNGHYRLARTCISYLSIMDLSLYNTIALSQAETIAVLEAEMMDPKRNRNNTEDILKCMDEFDRLITKTFPLLRYALESWISHIKEAEKNVTEQEDAFEYILWPSESLFRKLRDRKLPHYVESRWATMLHLAAEYQLLGQLRRILSKGSEIKLQVDKLDSYGQTPLLLAAKNGHTTAVRMLLGTSNKLHTMDVDYQNTEGNTPLMEAAANGYTEVVKMFLNTGKVDVNSQNYSKESALLLAAKGGHPEVVQTLVNTGRYFNTYRMKSLILFSIDRLLYWALQFLLNIEKVEISSTDSSGNSAISLAAREGHLEVLRTLLETREIDINSQNDTGMSPILLAAESGHIEVVQALLATGKVELDSKSHHEESAFLLAAQNGHLKVVQALLNTSKVDINSKNKLEQSPLILAAKKGHLDVVQALLDTGEVDIDSKSCDEESAFLLAAQNGHLKVVQALLDTSKVNINSENKRKQSPIMLAIRKGHLNIVKALLNTGKVELNLPKNLQDSLLFALKGGHLKIVQALLESGSVAGGPPTLPDCSTLILAAEKGYAKTARLLLHTCSYDVRHGETKRLRELGLGRWGSDWQFHLNIEERESGGTGGMQVPPCL